MTITEQLAAALRGILNNCQTVRPSEDNIAFSFSDPVNPSYIVSARRVDSARAALAAYDAQPAADDGTVERVARELAFGLIVHARASLGPSRTTEATQAIITLAADRDAVFALARAALAAMAAPAPAADDATVERVARAIEMALGDGDYVSDKWFGRSPKKSDATLSNAARAALAAMAAPAPDDGWQDIATAPKDGVILLFVPNGLGGKPLVRQGEWHATELQEAGWLLHHGPELYARWKPTHWRPLPPAPATQAKG